MDIIEATQIIQDSATANGRSFKDEIIYISENLRNIKNEELYTAWTAWHNIANDYMSWGANKSRIQQLARDVKNLEHSLPGSKEYFDSLF